MIACVRLPYFTATLYRSGEGGPLLVVRTAGRRTRVMACSPEAAAVGARPGMPSSAARALCPTAQIVPYAPGRVRRGLEAVMAALSAFSQWVEADKSGIQTGVVYVDLCRLRPSEGLALAHQMLMCMAELGFAASVGLASGKFCAHTAALLTPAGTVRLVGRGEEAAFLAPQPVERLPLDGETARRLTLFGLRQIGQLAALPRSALIAQFGKLGGRLHRLACGEDASRVTRYQPPRTADASRTFEPPLENRLPLEAVARVLAFELMRILDAQGLEAREIVLTVRLEGQGEQEAVLRPREPVASAPVLARALGRMLAKLSLAAPVCEVAVQLGRLAQLAPKQLSLFDLLEAPDPEKVLLDLTARYGTGVFYRVSANPLPSPLPEARYPLEEVGAA